MELKFRVRCAIFPEWVYSESHYNFCDFWSRINNQYLSDDWDVELEQEVNGEWITAYVVWNK